MYRKTWNEQRGQEEHVKGKRSMKKILMILLCAILLCGCEGRDFHEEMGQYEGDAAIMSETEAMMLFEEIFEINKYLDAGMTMQFDGSTVEIDGQTCICATLGTEENGEFSVQGHYAATWGSAYYLDPVTGDWSSVGFG